MNTASYELIVGTLVAGGFVDAADHKEAVEMISTATTPAQVFKILFDEIIDAKDQLKCIQALAGRP